MSLAGIAVLAAISLLANPWEEVGWRGFALDRLQEQCHPIVAALVVGIFWGLWHIPLFFLTGSGMTSFPLWPWFAGLIGRSYLVAWL